MLRIHPLDDDAGDDGGWDNESPDDDASESPYPGDDYPGSDYPGEYTSDEDISDADYERYESVGDYYYESGVTSNTLSLGSAPATDEDSLDEWEGPHEAPERGDMPGASPHAGQSTISSAPSTISSTSNPEMLPWSNAKYSVQVSNGIGWGFGYAFFLGPSATFQYYGSAGKRETELGAGGFLGIFGMGGFIAPPSPIPSVTLNVQLYPRSSNIAEINTGCVRSVMVALPFVSLQVSETQFGNGLPYDLSLSIGVSVGVGIFGGVSCGATFKSPSL
ncbi:hypothetical protein IB258_08705 [Achromobacter sp. ACM02]|nr:hypothetical protein [Achromobacter sp. ACM02]MBD9381315.1 hypothetical protein [Achromobacter sp. ACM02]MBD9474025.1 hypothetical protein [Achromobacter sp. ACM01]